MEASLASPVNYTEIPADCESTISEELDTDSRVLNCQLACIWLYSFLKWFKPSEPFLVEFMISKGLTNQEVYNKVFPIWIFCHLPALLLVAISSRAIGCRFVVLVGTLCGALTTGLTLMAPHGGLTMLQLSQVIVALSWSTHSAFSALCLASLEPSSYQAATHGSRGAALAASCISALIGQTIRPVSGLYWLFGVSLLGQLLAFFVALCLPIPANQSHSNTCRARAGEGETSSEPTFVDCLWNAWRLLPSSIVILWEVLQVPSVLSWTCWALVAESVHRFTLTYWQNLVKSIVMDTSSNGLFYSIMYLTAAMTTIATSKAKLSQHSSAIKIISPLLCGLLLLKSSEGPIALTYVCLVLYQNIHEITAATCSTEVGTRVNSAINRSML